MNTEVSQEDLDKIAEFIERPPRGMLAIPSRTKSGAPAVAKVSPVVDNLPFPTIYWLVDPVIYKKISHLEGTGFTKELQREIKANPELQETVRSIHAAYRQERIELFKELELKLPENMMKTINETGIGGVADPTHLRCLHMFYAFHLVNPHYIGKRIDQEILNQNL